MSAPLHVFLTAYAPTELPGGTVVGLLSVMGPLDAQAAS